MYQVCDQKGSSKKWIIVVLVIMTFVVFKAQASGIKGDKMVMKASVRAKVETQVKTELLAILSSYEKLHSAFFTYDGAIVESSAKELSQLISKLSDIKIAGLLKFSQAKLAELTASSTRVVNNQNLHLVSMALIHIVKTYDVGANYNVYSCPMVKKKWLQNSKKLVDISNPYAPNMPNCGSQSSHF